MLVLVNYLHPTPAPECYGLELSTASLFYINWATAVGWPILTTIIVTIICKSLVSELPLCKPLFYLNL